MFFQSIFDVNSQVTQNTKLVTYIHTQTNSNKTSYNSKTTTNSLFIKDQPQLYYCLDLIKIPRKQSKYVDKLQNTTILLNVPVQDFPYYMTVSKRKAKVPENDDPIYPGNDQVKQCFTTTAQGNSNPP